MTGNSILQSKSSDRLTLSEVEVLSWRGEDVNTLLMAVVRNASKLLLPLGAAW
ncbi:MULTISPECIES: hypothetical protein [unclassified Coleofasciculus]|uniref:hypothetical protein n=1 Tax=unclassified Coleofasciculus TaxID=2692782 RepID=UPI001880AF42|nr:MULTISPECIES: hypothetical protein [unclassified Coleofasciculus]MBE9125593.1 hypothetical protein [Coleofasciculus sp. LEGE 07081]MBE9147307.1 hypothetical protein [Coleofasciculus sp. LEGE 07092]